MAIEIRTAREADLEGVLELYRHLNPQDIVLDHDEAATILKDIVQAPHLQIFLVEEAGEAVATCYLNVIENLMRQGSPYALIENVVTHKEHRRNGYGRLVVRHAVEKAWEAGCYKVMLLTGNPDNIPFYQACGFDASSKLGLVARRGS